MSKVAYGRTSRRRTRLQESGSALVEAMLVSSFAALLLAAVPLIAGYGSAYMQVTAAAKLNAWQRTVWFPEKGEASMSDDQHKGALGSIRKSDAELASDLRRHMFRDTSLPMHEGVHAENTSEFTGQLATIPRYDETLVATTTAATLPSVAAFMDKAFSEIGKVQDKAKGESIEKFRFVTQGYFRTEVELSRTAGSVLTRFPTEFGIVRSAMHRNDVPLPQKLTIRDHVTMLSEPWSAGGTNREESKIQGLVPTKLLDRPEYQDFRAPLHQLGYTIKSVLPNFDVNKLTMGITPGDAMEKMTPWDRHEWDSKVPDTANHDDTEEMAKSGCSGVENIGVSKDCFRFYRSFPPPPVVNTLP